MTRLNAREIATYGALSPLFRRNLVREASAIRERAFWTPERMDGFRLERLRETLRHAAGTVPYYAELFEKHRFDIESLRSFEELAAIPPLTRQLLRERFADLRSSIVPDDAVQRRSTGGTSGTPVTVVLDRAGDAERMLVNHRMYALMNRPLGTRTLMIAGSPIDTVAWMTARDRVKNRIFGIDVVSSFDLTHRTLQTLIARLSSRRYRWVIAYASVFDILAMRVRERGILLHIPNIIPSAELISDAQRERWKEIFGCRIFEIYGSREMTSIAGELPDHDGLAVSGDLYHVEIADQDGRPLPPGEPGMITITTLGERGMPLIRYQLGDVGILQPPPAGSPVAFQRLRLTHGRILDIIRCPDGKMLPGEFFPHLMKEVESSVERFQVIQPALERLIVRLVPRTDYNAEVADYLRRHIQAQVGDGVKIDFELVDFIDTSTSGKYRPTICLLPQSEKKLPARR